MKTTWLSQNQRLVFVIILLTIFAVALGLVVRAKLALDVVNQEQGQSLTG